VKSFETYALKLGDTTQRLGDDPVREWVSRLNTGPSDTPLPSLPEETNKGEVTPTDIYEFLFDRGVASNSIEKLLSEMGELVRIAKWYQRSTTKPSEHETVGYLAAPLLRALG
jgi:hypothetical protein